MQNWMPFSQESFTQLCDSCFVRRPIFGGVLIFIGRIVLLETGKSHLNETFREGRRLLGPLTDKLLPEPAFWMGELRKTN